MKTPIGSPSLKLWLVATILAFILLQVPLIYIYRTTESYANTTYASLLGDFTRSWVQMALLMLLPSFLTFICIRAIYQPKWSIKVLKLSVLMISLLFVLFAFVLYSFFFISKYSVPVIYIFVVFFASYTISVSILNYKPLIGKFYQEHLSRQ